MRTIEERYGVELGAARLIDATLEALSIAKTMPLSGRHIF